MSKEPSELTAAERDADEAFFYDEVGGAVQPCSAKAPPKTLSPDKPHWIEIAMVDVEGNPVTDQDYEITLPNGSIVTGSLDAGGVARIQGIDSAGDCKVRYPSLDKSAVSKK